MGSNILEMLLMAHMAYLIQSYQLHLMNVSCLLFLFHNLVCPFNQNQNVN
jgi:hypothetical protein